METMGLNNLDNHKNRETIQNLTEVLPEEAAFITYSSIKNCALTRIMLRQ